MTKGRGGEREEEGNCGMRTEPISSCFYTTQWDERPASCTPVSPRAVPGQYPRTTAKGPTRRIIPPTRKRGLRASYSRTQSSFPLQRNVSIERRLRQTLAGAGAVSCHRSPSDVVYAQARLRRWPGCSNGRNLRQS